MRRVLLCICVAFVVFASVQAYGDATDDIVNDMLNKVGGVNDMGDVVKLAFRVEDDVNAQAALGASAFKRRDYEHAFITFSQSAQRGHAPSQYVLGVLYLNGWGTAKDYRKAFSLFHQATTSPSLRPAAEYMLGYMHENGFYVDKDAESARVNYLWAAVHGHEDAQRALGIRVIPAEELAESLHQNMLKTKKTYGGKKIIVRGVVSGISSEAFTDRPVVEFQAWLRDYGPTFIKFSLLEEEPPAQEEDEDGWESPVYSLQKGEYATIEGTISNIGEQSISVKDCEILAID